MRERERWRILRSCSVCVPQGCLKTTLECLMEQLCHPVLSYLFFLFLSSGLSTSYSRCSALHLLKLHQKPVFLHVFNYKLKLLCGLAESIPESLSLKLKGDCRCYRKHVICCCSWTNLNKPVQPSSTRHSTLSYSYLNCSSWKWSLNCLWLLLQSHPVSQVLSTALQLVVILVW